MGSFTTRQSWRVLCVLVAVTLAGCGGGGGNGADGGATVAVEPVPAQSVTWQPAEALPAQSVNWQAGSPTGIGGGYPVSNGASFAIDNAGTAYFFTPTLDSEVATATVADARAYRHPFAGAWDVGVVVGAPVGTRGVRSGVSRDYEEPQVKLDDAGNAFAIYTLADATAASERDYLSQVLVRRRDAASGTWGTEAALGSVPGVYASAPRIVVERGGAAWAVWTERTVKDPVQRAGDLYAVFASRFVGPGWSTAERISPDFPFRVDARIDTDKAGNPRVLIAVNSAPLTPSSTAFQVVLYYSARSAAGVWSPLAEVANPGQGSLVDYAIAVDADDNALAIWTQFGSTATGTAVFSRRFTPAGGWRGAELLVPDQGAFLGFAFAADSAGNAILLYPRYDAARQAFMLFAARFEKNRGWASAQRISNFTGANDSVTSPGIAFDGSGNAVAVWTQFRTAASRLEVRTASYSISRGGWGVNETISPDVRATGYRVEFAMSRSGNATALWWQFGATSLDSWSADRPASAGF